MQISKTTNHGNLRWRVTHSLMGKRQQRFFSSRDDAREWMRSIEGGHDGFWENRTVEEQRDIISAFNLVSEKGLSIYRCLLESSGRLNLNPIPIKEAASRYSEILKRRSLRPASLAQTQLQLVQLTRELDSQMCHSVTAGQLEMWFAKRKWTRSTVDGVIGKVGPFFTWCVREGYCVSNPCKAVKRPRSDDSPPSIFSPSEAKKLLKTASTFDSSFVPYLAIGLFAGVRPAEILRLKKSSIKRGYIEITAASSKTRKRRLITISPNLKKWLEFDGDYPPLNKRRRLAKLLKLAKLEWKPDIMRHSYASYHLAQFESADKTALEMGHRDTQMLFRHYRELVTKEEADCYWRINPICN